ncbi:MAG TPA: hypothetical protein VMU07_00175 [Candidatus Paceibacterota bacterium]|nr:hypothetical protein [Candidatus Paceibacterota bacterium]
MGKNFTRIIILLFVLVIVAAGVWYYLADNFSGVDVVNSPVATLPPQNTSTSVALTSTTTSSASTSLDLNVSGTSSDPLLKSLSENSIQGAGAGSQISSSLNASGTTYQTLFNTTRCVKDSDRFTGPGCDIALVATDKATHEQTVVVPSFWQAIPQLKSTAYGQVDILYADSNNIYLNVYSQSQTGAPVGFFKMSLADNQVAKLGFTGSLICTVISPDDHYVAGDTQNGSSSNVEVFSFGQNKDVFTKTLTLPQTLWNGSIGPGCNLGISWIATDTMQYVIYDSSNPNTDGMFPILKKATSSFPGNG